jgi:hypothetical protein
MIIYRRNKLATSCRNAALALLAPWLLSGCLSDGGSSDTATAAAAADPTAPVVPAVISYPTPPAIPVAPVAIGAWSNPGGGFTRITTTTTGISNGDAVQISGVTNVCCTGYNAIVNISNVTAIGFDIPIAYLGDGGSAFTITQIIAGGALPPGASASCPTVASTGALGVITPSISASRLSGVAPLAVFFDASATTATGVSRPFHDLEYRWKFNDAPGEFWTAGSRTATGSTRNEATGPVAAHVFKTPGTYLIEVTITDGTNTVVNDCLQIAVLDPDVVFSGTNTVCLSTSGTFGGCPAGAANVNTSITGENFVAAITNYATTGKRVLFRVGETWDAPTQAFLVSTGPGTIGSYSAGGVGVGGTARIRATANMAEAILQLARSTTPGLADWRVMDLEFDGNGNGSRQAINSGGGINQVTLLRLNMHDVHNGLLLDGSTLDFAKASNPAHTIWDQIALVDSVTTNITGVSSALSVYASAWRFMLLGNNLNNSGGGEHTVRLPSIVGGVISNNTMQGQGTAAGSKQAFTLRADVHGTTGVEGGYDSQRVVVSDNRFVGENGSQWTVFYGPQAAADERIYDVITERNWFSAAGGPATGTQVSLAIFAREQTIRNNLFETSGGKQHIAISVNDGLVVGSNQVRIFHNSVFSNDADNDFAVLEVRSGALNVSVRNNVAYSPNDTQHSMVSFATAPAAVVLQSGNTPFADVRLVDPLFTTTPPTTPTHWKPLGASYANTGGDTTVPVWSDFFRVNRPLMGAARGTGAAQ